MAFTSEVGLLVSKKRCPPLAVDSRQCAHLYLFHSSNVKQFFSLLETSPG